MALTPARRPGRQEELKMEIPVGASAAILESFRPAPDRT